MWIFRPSFPSLASRYPHSPSGRHPVTCCEATIVHPGHAYTWRSVTCATSWFSRQLARGERIGLRLPIAARLVGGRGCRALVFCWFAPHRAQNHCFFNGFSLFFQCFPWIRLGPEVGRVLRGRNAEGINILMQLLIHAVFDRSDTPLAARRIGSEPLVPLGLSSLGYASYSTCFAQTAAQQLRGCPLLRCCLLLRRCCPLLRHPLDVHASPLRYPCVTP